VLIPDSTRRLFSYLAGAAIGTDLSWEGMQQAMNDKLPGTPRSPINDQQSMICSAATFVAYYQQALQGKYFTKPATLGEFKRIQAMADAIALVVPPDTVAYAKGGASTGGIFMRFACRNRCCCDAGRSHSASR
jgi:beta-lactamase class A